MAAKHTSRMSISYILCENVRQELHGKVSLLGVFLGSRIQVLPRNDVRLPEGVVAILDGLAIVATLYGGAGRHDASFKMLSPSKKVVAKGELGVVDLDAAGAKAMIVGTNEFKVPEFGRYVAKFKVGKRRFDFPFDIVLREQK